MYKTSLKIKKNFDFCFSNFFLFYINQSSHENREKITQIAGDGPWVMPMCSKLSYQKKDWSKHLLVCD